MYAYIFACVCMYVGMHVCRYEVMYVCMYVGRYVCMHVCINVFMRLHTVTHKTVAHTHNIYIYIYGEHKYSFIHVDRHKL